MGRLESTSTSPHFTSCRQLRNSARGQMRRVRSQPRRLRRRCIRAPCHTNRERWEGRTDSTGVVGLPISPGCTSWVARVSVAACSLLSLVCSTESRAPKPPPSIEAATKRACSISATRAVRSSIRRAYASSAPIERGVASAFPGPTSVPLRCSGSARLLLPLRAPAR